MLLSPIRRLFVKAWTQPLPSFFDRRSFLYQRFPSCTSTTSMSSSTLDSWETTPGWPQRQDSAIFNHWWERNLADARSLLLYSISILVWPLFYAWQHGTTWQDNRWKGRRDLIFERYSNWISDHYSTPDNTERFSRTVSGRDHQIWYPGDGKPIIRSRRLDTVSWKWCARIWVCQIPSFASWMLGGKHEFKPG